MDTATVRVTKTTKGELERTSKELGIPQSKVVSVALKELRKKILLNAICADFVRLRADKEASREYDKEVAAWEGIPDGLEEPY